MQMNCLFLPPELNIKRAFFAFSVAFLILNSWNIWFTFTAKGSWCLSVLAKTKIIYEFNNFFFHFYIFWSFHNCTRLCWTAKANRSHHVASQNIENVIFLMNACYLCFSFCFRKGHISGNMSTFILACVQTSPPPSEKIGRRFFLREGGRLYTGYICFSIVCLIRERRGTLGGTQYRNTLRKIGKYRNTESKIDEIPTSHLWSVTLT